MGMGQAGGVVGWLVLCVFWVARYAKASAGVWCRGAMGVKVLCTQCAVLSCLDTGWLQGSFSTTSRLR